MKLPRPDQWVAMLIDVNLTGRVLLFHSIHKQHWTFGEFRPVPADLTLAQAAEMLQAPQSSALLSSSGPQLRSAPSSER